MQIFEGFISHLFAARWPDVCPLQSTGDGVALRISSTALPGIMLVMLFAQAEDRVAKGSGNSTKGPSTTRLSYRLLERLLAIFKQ